MQKPIEVLLLRRFFWNQQALSAKASLFAIGGIGLGVAVLYVALSVMSGFEMTLKQSLMDVRGHLTLVKRSTAPEPWQELFEKVKQLDSRILEATPFLSLEGVTASSGQVQAILIQGLDSENFAKVIKLENRLTSGALNIQRTAEGPGALVGAELATRLGKAVGDKINVVVPRFGDLETSGYRRAVQSFHIRGILDAGKYDWNERLIVIDLKEAQKLAEVKNRYAGLMLTVKDPELADEMATELVGKLNGPFWVRDWKSEHENTFAAVQIERRIIFFVVFIIVIVAAFALASNLLLQTLQKASDLAVLRSMGMRARQILFLFISQGLALGLAGIFVGLLLGGISTYFIEVYQEHNSIISGSVYRISRIDLSIRGLDLLWIVGSTLLVSAMSGLLPALRAAQKVPSQGLKYE